MTFSTGIFTAASDTVVGNDGSQTRFMGLDRVAYATTASGDFNWPNPAAGSLTQNGEGVFTPGGVEGSPVKYGGTGMWVTAPKDPATGAYLPGGVTTLTNVTLTLSITAKFPSGVTPYAPVIGGANQPWTIGASYPLSSTNTTTANPDLEMTDEPTATVTPNTSSVSGNTWTGSLTLTIAGPWVVDGPTTPLSQFLLGTIGYSSWNNVTRFEDTWSLVGGTYMLQATGKTTQTGQLGPSQTTTYVV